MAAKLLGAVWAVLLWLAPIGCSRPPAASQLETGYASPGPIPPPAPVQAVAGKQFQQLELELTREHARLPHPPGAQELRREPTGGLDSGRGVLQVEVTVYYRSGPVRRLDWLTGPIHPLADVLDWYALALADQGWSVRRQQADRLGAWVAFDHGNLSGAVLPANFRSPEMMPSRADEFAVNLVVPPAPLDWWLERGRNQARNR